VIVGEKDKISFYVVNNFFKNVIIKGLSENFNLVAVHIEGLRHPPICFWHFFSCHSLSLSSRVVDPDSVTLWIQGQENKEISVGKCNFLLFKQIATSKV
jgi:hypothetical protein